MGGKRSKKKTKRNRTYTLEQKQEAVRLVQVSGQSINDVARDLGIPGNTLWNWVRKQQIDAGEIETDEPTTDDREELQRLRRENRRLRMERDFLKKAAAFFAKDGEDGFR